MEKQAKERTQSVVNLRGKAKFGICTVSWLCRIPHISDFSALQKIKAETHLQILSPHLVDVNHAERGHAPASHADLRAKRSDTVIWGRRSRSHVDIAFFVFIFLKKIILETGNTPDTCYCLTHCVCMSIVSQKQVQCVMPVHFWRKQTVDSNRKKPISRFQIRTKAFTYSFCLLFLLTSTQLC